MAQHKLAAIMFSDIVDYDSLLKEDEKKAFEILRKNQRINKRLIRKFKGRWLKDMESGTLASFSSIIDAVTCALAIQKVTIELNIPVRIGIHQGEVIFEKKDVLGDGVNIASRIHSLIDTHDIVISDTVYKDIRNKEGLLIESLGSQTLKGVESPVGIYSVSCRDESVLDFTIDTGELVRPLSFKRSSIIIGIIVIALMSFAIYYFIPKSTSSSEFKKRVLILPPENYLGTDTLDYLFAGMHDLLIGDMGKIGALNVISRTSAVAFKKEGKSMSEMASEYNIDYIVEYSVLCYDDSVCTQFKVYDEKENELSVQDFSVEKSQILSLYNNVTKDIADRINITLTPQQEKLLSEARTVDLEAYDDYMKGYQYIGDYSLESLNKAKEYYISAIKKDPNWAPLYAGLAGVWLGLQHLGYESPSVATPNIYENLNKALELDPDLSDVHVYNASIAHWMEWDWEKSEKEFIKALAINPNDAVSRIWYAQLLGTLQRPEEAKMQGQLAFELDPLNPLIKCWYGALLVAVGDCETALALAEEVVADDPDHALANGVIYWAAFSCEDYDKVIKSQKYWLQMDGGEQFNEDTYMEIERIYNEQGFSAAYREVMKQYEEFTNYSSNHPVDMANMYVKANQLDKAMVLLEKGFELHDPQMIYITVYPFDPLFDNPRFIDIVEKMNLPFP